MEKSKMSFLSNNWPWYISGIVIGLFVPLLFILRGKVFGVSASLRHICAAFPLSRIKYFSYNWKEEGAWNLYFVIGIVMRNGSNKLKQSLFLKNLKKK